MVSSGRGGDDGGGGGGDGGGGTTVVAVEAVERWWRSGGVRRWRHTATSWTCEHQQNQTAPRRSCLKLSTSPHSFCRELGWSSDAIRCAMWSDCISIWPRRWRLTPPDGRKWRSLTFGAAERGCWVPRGASEPLRQLGRIPHGSGGLFSQLRRPCSASPCRATYRRRSRCGARAPPSGRIARAGSSAARASTRAATS